MTSKNACHVSMSPGKAVITALVLAFTSMISVVRPGLSLADAEQMARARHLLEKGEKSLELAALESAEQILKVQCQGPARDPLCEYYLARVHLAQFSYFSQVKGDKTKASRALSRAEAAGKQAVSRRPNDASAHVLMGKIYQVKLTRHPVSEITRAMISNSPVVKEYERALQLEPDSAEAELGLGIYYQFMPRFLGGDGHRARNHFKRAARLMPKNPEPLVWVSISYREEDRLDDAREYLDRALAIAPNNRFVQAEKERLKAAEQAQGAR